MVLEPSQSGKSLKSNDIIDDKISSFKTLSLTVTKVKVVIVDTLLISWLYVI